MEEVGLKTALHLESITSLEVLDLAGNKISEFNDIENLASLPKLKQLVLLGNPISRKNCYRQILLHRLPRLFSLDGKQVFAEEQERADYFLVQDPCPFPQTTSVPQVIPGLGTAKVPVKINSVSFDVEPEKAVGKGKAKRGLNSKTGETAKTEGDNKFAHQETSSSKGSAYYVPKQSPNPSYAKKHIPRGYNFK